MSNVKIFDWFSWINNVVVEEIPSWVIVVAPKVQNSTLGAQVTPINNYIVIFLYFAKSHQ